jgi:uncharacterized protein YdhG (YjbR/CyaY superfamily)
MKKKRVGKPVPATRVAAATASVDQYIAAAPASSRSALQQIRNAIRSAVPPRSTEVISYRIPAFKYQRVLVWYGAFANHCSLFPTAAVIEQFKDQLDGFNTSTGTVQFPLDKPLPVSLIKKMVKARVAKAESKKSQAARR